MTVKRPNYILNMTIGFGILLTLSLLFISPASPEGEEIIVDLVEKGSEKLKEKWKNPEAEQKRLKEEWIRENSAYDPRKSGQQGYWEQREKERRETDKIYSEKIEKVPEEYERNKQVHEKIHKVIFDTTGMKEKAKEEGREVIAW